MTQRIPLQDLTTEAAVEHHTPPSKSPNSQSPSSQSPKLGHIYVREIGGFFQRIRRHSNWLLMALYFGLPWINWGDRPLVWFDLSAQEFHLFASTFYPQDFILLTWILVLCAFGLFLITVVAGRVWCGYSCPQSVWTFLFIWFEHRLEGPRHRRIRRDKAPNNIDTLWRKTAKHMVWLLIALATGIAFVGYFTPIRELVVDTFTLDAHPLALFWIGFFTLFTYLNAGWLRHQVCLHMCPYARFQSAMFDADTLIVSYDAARGEPRRNHSQKGVEATRAGDCIDCELCVQVCPTGIDIRDGLQYECIGCAACIDACDSVMARIDKPLGLIRYTTERALEGKTTRFWRPQLLAYTAALLSMVVLLVGFLNSRVPIDVDVVRDRQTLFESTAEGRIINYYNVTLRNQDDQTHRYAVSATGLPGLRLQGMDTIEVSANETRSLRLALTADAGGLSRPSHSIELRFIAFDDPSIVSVSETRFLGPAGE
ncbi:cytochrome c oxidase accessory protein CcoG [Halomonas sp. ISL-60]|uniref:cytochrome c oxidase accessory protein CcoG n=1 Tax=Halomonas sp. ISL-56 TaxID=2819149 RepID=UPI001BE6E746|nr:cytochrome c oxidase accessory protein CcoG [Halomonas sp. ISL-56]MBT2774843.1 cytochrome c oxidase accessory protein CcoG [Halomonas sp. ISL-60]MBT2801245.1 cytochrome c oxidase accessory protein CcoG [Halomonas sp. ISL-56]